MYNTKYICNYQASDIFFETDVVTEEEKDFIKNALYRNDLLYIFDMDDFVEEEINRCMKELHDKIQDCKELNDLIDNNTEGYKKDKTKYPATISIQDNRKAKPTLSPIDYHISNNDQSTLNNQKKRKADQSSQQVVSKKKSSSSSSKNQIAHLSEFECKSILYLLEEAYSEFLAGLIVELRSNQKLFSSEAKVSNRSINQEQQSSDDDIDNDSFIDEEEEDIEEDDNSSYLRLENQHNMEGEDEWDEHTLVSLPVEKKHKKKPKPTPKRGVTSSSNSKNDKNNKPPPPPPRNHPKRDRNPSIVKRNNP